MKNFVKHAANITVSAPYAVTSGQGVKVGNFFGVATANAAIGQPVEISLTGAFDMAKTAGQTFTQGAKVYWDDAAKAMTASATGTFYIGAAMLAAAGADAAVRVRLNGVSLA